MAGSKKNKLKKAAQAFTVQNASEADDEQLMDDLLAELDARSSTVRHEAATVIQEIELAHTPPKQESKNRFQARQARKQAALVANYSESDPLNDAKLQQEAREEEKAISRICDELNFTIHEINPDGHCLFSAVADQLALLSILPASQANHAVVRAAAANYIYSHPDDFLPFLPSTSGEDGVGADSPGLMSNAEFQQYCTSVRDTAVWGGEPEILALCRYFNVPIYVVQGGSPPVVTHVPSGTPNEDDIRKKPGVRISYHRRMYGLGEHYNSLRPRSGLSQIIPSEIRHLLS